MPAQAKDESVGYGVKSSTKLRYGKAFVKIPEKYLAKLRSPGKWDGMPYFKAADELLDVRNRVPLALHDFARDLREEVSRTGDRKHLLVYVHGFNVSFDDSLKRGAALGYNIGVPVAVFSWPSLKETTPMAYAADRDAALASRDLLASYLATVARSSGAEKVHVIAHSMGTMLFLDMLARRSFYASGVRFGQVVLAAADTDEGQFRSNIEYLTTAADRVTLYASDGDEALNISQKLAKDRRRVGLLPPPTIVPNVDTMDVSKVNLTWLGHAFVANEVAVLRDMGALIHQDCPPARRVGVKSVQLGDQTYWQLEKSNIVIDSWSAACRK
jgi:esterase/lipase superfamily enzyme